MLRIVYLKRKKKQNKTKTYQKQKERACKDHFIKAVKRRVKERDMISRLIVLPYLGLNC